VTVKSKDPQATAGKAPSSTNKPTTNGAKHTAADAPAIAAKPAPKNAQEALADPKIWAQIAETGKRIHSTLGQVVLAMVALPRYQYLSLIDLKAIAPNLDQNAPLIRAPLEPASLIVATHKKDDDAPSLEIGALDNVAGIAIWASVSTEVDARIRAQVKARVFPVKLKPEDWTSGNTDGGDHAPLSQEGLLDVIAPTSTNKSPKLASMVLASFSRLVKSGELNVHPVAARQVDADMLRKLAGAPQKTA
jgi:cytolysin-activating lysine-acyltransferase